MTFDTINDIEIYPLKQQNGWLLCVKTEVLYHHLSLDDIISTSVEAAGFAPE